MLVNALALALLSSMPPMPDARALIEKSWNRTHVVGHRGAAAYLPENTLDSFRKAIEVGASATECDVHMSKDGVAMVMHDETLDRTTDLTGAVKETPAKTMTDAGIPTLEDFIKVCKNKIVAVIEIKKGEGVVPEVVRLVRKHKTESQTIIFSFNHDFVTEAKKLAPEITAIWLVSKRQNPEEFPAFLAKVQEAKADGVGFQFLNTYPELATKLREEEIPLFCWTVPPGEQITRLADLKVNFIITDHPKDVLESLAAR